MKLTLSKSVFFLLLFLSKNVYAKTYSKVFASDFDVVWKGVLISLSKYPLDKNDQDSGIVITSIVKAGEIFSHYNEKSNYKKYYQLFIDVEKFTIHGQRAIRVNIEKKPYLKGDFMNKKKMLKSSGIEERIFLYRVLREIRIDKKIAKVYK